MTGTPSRNTEPHQKYSNMTPLTIGPSAEPPNRQAVHNEMVSPRCRSKSA